MKHRTVRQCYFHRLQSSGCCSFPRYWCSESCERSIILSFSVKSHIEFEVCNRIAFLLFSFCLTINSHFVSHNHNILWYTILIYSFPNPRKRNQVLTPCSTCCLIPPATVEATITLTIDIHPPLPRSFPSSNPSQLPSLHKLALTAALTGWGTGGCGRVCN